MGPGGAAFGTVIASRSTADAGSRSRGRTPEAVARNERLITLIVRRTQLGVDLLPIEMPLHPRRDFPTG
jgi:hypothetical protein